MFDNDYKLMPRTYSLKSYKRQKGFNFGRFMKYITFFAVLASILAITILSATHLI